MNCISSGSEKEGKIKTERKEDYDKTPSSSSPEFKRRISLRQVGRFTDFVIANSSRIHNDATGFLAGDWRTCFHGPI